MAYAFDTLGYSKTLRQAGIPTEQAEAHAEAGRGFIMVELVTKEDLRAAMEMQTLQIPANPHGAEAGWDLLPWTRAAGSSQSPDPAKPDTVIAAAGCQILQTKELNILHYPEFLPILPTVKTARP